LVGATALLLTAVVGSGVKTSIAPKDITRVVRKLLEESMNEGNLLSANDLVAVVLSSEHLEGGFDHTTSKTEDKMEGRLW
jgi:hypothetical protein